MRPERSYQDLASRLSRLVDGLLDENETAELEALLRDNPAARDYYRRYLATHLDLAEHFEQDTTAVSPPVRPRRTAVLLAAAALLPLAAGLGLWWMIQSVGNLPEPPPVVSTAAPGPVLAVTARTEGVRWSLPRPPATGLKLRSRTIRLTSGRLLLDLMGGQTVTLQAPAEFELLTETEMFLAKGEAALDMGEGRQAYIIRVPGGAIVDLGTEFSVKVAEDGTTDVHVFDGMVNASVTGPGERTRTERLLNAGESAQISDTLGASSRDAGDFLRSLAPGAADASPANETYASAVEKSGPLAWWRFDHLTPRREVLAEAGDWPLTLHGNPVIAGSPGRQFLQTDTGKAAGFAVPETSIPGLDTPAGVTIECLLHPSSERHGCALTLENPDLSPGDGGRFAHVRHAPQRMAIERMARRGSKIGHVHPDFALRAMMRSPAGYDGGTNTYSAESHLLHRWVHVAFTNDGSALRLYIDGQLSDEARVDLQFQNATLRPIIGRLQPLPVGEKRQWTGGIDEVALYGRVLSAEEISAHAGALDR